ncbi:hypothetical protein ABW19_dt0203487 [Dactylella cylindrospora]|nr:hypothetical protein ABW19_dt0203487 [Dactylella cylindrospora]
MSSRLVVPEVGSVQWISNELSDAHNKESDHFEDFTIAIRNELEWLNEHMAEIFHQGSNMKINLIEEENNDQFFAPRPLAADLEPQGGLPTRSPSKFPVAEEPQSEASTPDLVRDSGAWSGSSGPTSLAGSFGIIAAEAVERSSPAKKPSYEVAPQVVAESAEQRSFSDVSRKSFLSAKEEQMGRQSEPSSPVSPSSPAHHPVPERQDDGVSSGIIRRVSGSPQSDNAADEPMQPLGKPAGLKSPEMVPLSPIDAAPVSHTPARSVHAISPVKGRAYSISPVQISSPMQPSSPISPIQQTPAVFTPKAATKEQAAESDTPSEAASPATGMTRSSMNFASLPARETLTHKKSMGGNNTASRSSHVDDRTSFFGRLTGGKSLGASSIGGDGLSTDSIHFSGPNAGQSVAPNMSDEEDDDDDLNEQLRLAEINKASVMQLSEKTSTQRLNEKISQLSQQGTTRLSKSISASSFTAPPTMEDGQGPNSNMVKPVDGPSKARESTQSDEGDWIPSRPQFAKTETALAGPSSPIRMVSKSPQKTAPAFPSKPTSQSPKKAFATPVVTKLPVPTSTAKQLAEGNIKYPSIPTSGSTPKPSNETTTPSRTRLVQDVEVSAAKKNQANIFSFAKQLLWRSGRSESPKPQELPKQSPQKPSQERLYPEIVESDTATVTDSHSQPLYPSILPPASRDTSRPDTKPLDHHSSENEPFQRPPNPEPPKGKFLTYGTAGKRDVQLKGPSPAVIDGIDLVPEHADDRLQSPVISENDPSLPGSPFSDAAGSDADDDYEGDDDPVDVLRSTGPSPRKISRKSSPHSQTPTKQRGLKEPKNRTSLQSKATDLKKPVRGLFGVKEGGIGKPKQVASNIRLVTASQREMDQRKKGPAIHPPSTTVLSNALADTFGPPKDPIPRPASALSTASTQSLRAPKSIAALASAAKAQKKEQEERERKAAQKQEIERRRQENIRREEARREEERKQHAIKTTKKPMDKTSDDDSKKRPHAPTKGTQPLLHSSKLLPKAAPFSHQKPPAVDRNVPPKSSQDLKRQPKRLFQEEDVKPRKEEPMLSKPTQAPEAKRRKTGEMADVSAPSTSAPPIRQSTAKKENLPPSKIGGIFSQDYTPAPHHHHPQYNSASSLVKSTVQQQAMKSGNALPHVDAVKFSQDKLKFGTMVTPAPQKTVKQPTTISRESPLYPNPETIELPEIHTDSEDDVDDKSFHVPKWADSPELRQALQDQLGMDPETIFGPIAPLSMEDIFKGRADRAKFRARTSSANWSGADRLTAAEIEADRIERQRILDNGGWTYQKPQ